MTVRSRLLKLPFSLGDVVMAEGLTISDLLEPIDVGLNILPFLGLQSLSETGASIRDCVI